MKRISWFQRSLSWTEYLKKNKIIQFQKSFIVYLMKCCSNLTLFIIFFLFITFFISCYTPLFKNICLRPLYFDGNIVLFFSYSILLLLTYASEKFPIYIVEIFFYKVTDNKIVWLIITKKQSLDKKYSRSG